MTNHLLGHQPQPSASRAGSVQRDLALQASPGCKLLEHKSFRRWTHLEDYEHCATTEHPEEGHQVKEYDLKRKPHDYVIHALHIKHIIIIKHMFYPQKNTWWHEYYPCITNNFPKGKLNWRILKKRKVCCEDSSDSTNTKFWNKCFHMFCKTNLWSECPTLMSEIGVCNMSWFQTKVNLMTAGPKFTYLFPSALSFDIQNCIWYFSYRKIETLDIEGSS